jgi:hypothetical protein
MYSSAGLRREKPAANLSEQWHAVDQLCSATDVSVALMYLQFVRGKNVSHGMNTLKSAFFFVETV